MENENVNLSATALLVSLHISQWLPFVKDKEISDGIANDTASTKNAVTVRKHLFPDNCFPELDKLISEISKFYQWHADETLVWNGNGQRLIPLVTVDEHKTKFDALNDSIPGLVDAVVYGYADAIERAKTKLTRVLPDGTVKSIFKERDYPTTAELRTRFSVSVQYDAIPATIQSGILPAAVTSMLNGQIESRVKNSIGNAIADCWNRLFTCVNNLHAKLAQPTAIFRDSLIINVRECCDVLTKLNITQDPTLEGMRNKAFADLAKYDPDTVRDNPNLRAELASVADGMIREMKTRTIVRLDDMD